MKVRLQDDKSRRWMLGAGFATLACTTLAGASPSHRDIASLASRAAHGKERRLQILLPYGSRPNIAPIAAEFKRLTGVDVVMTEVPVDEVDVQLTLDKLRGTRTYDLALPATFAIPDLVAGGVIAPLDDIHGFDAVAQSQDDSLFTTGDTFDDAHYGFQTDGDAYVMFYNADFTNAPGEKDRFADQFGVALETPRTWQDLDRQMAWFHRPEDGKIGGMLFRNPAYVAWEWWIRSHAMGIWPLSKGMTPQLANDAGIGALEDMIRATEFLAPEALTAGLFENWARYACGDIYANVGWGGSQKFFNKPRSYLRGKLTYGKTPGGLIGNQLLVTPYFNWGWNYVILAGSSKTELALHFAAFATSPEMSTLAVRQQDGFFDPFRTEHYADLGIQDAYSTDFLKVHQESMQQAIPDLYLARQGDYFLSLSKWIARALNGLSSPEDALARVEQQWDIITAEIGREKQTERWLALRAKYPDQAQQLLSDL